MANETTLTPEQEQEMKNRANNLMGALRAGPLRGHACGFVLVRLTEPTYAKFWHSSQDPMQATALASNCAASWRASASTDKPSFCDPTNEGTGIRPEHLKKVVGIAEQIIGKEFGLLLILEKNGKCCGMLSSGHIRDSDFAKLFETWESKGLN